MAKMAKKEKKYKKCDLCGKIVEINGICKHCHWKDNYYQYRYPHRTGANNETLYDARYFWGLPHVGEDDWLIYHVKKIRKNNITKASKGELIKCPCCGQRMLEPYDICVICRWENDDLQYVYPNYKGGANDLSLNDMRDVMGLPPIWDKSNKRNRLKRRRYRRKHNTNRRK